jgi:hypothetical protein
MLYFIWDISEVYINKQDASSQASYICTNQKNSLDCDGVESKNFKACASVISHPVNHIYNHFLFLFIYLVRESIGTVATPGLLCQPRVIVKMIVE